MLGGYLKILTIFIPLMMLLRDVQSKECFSCSGINCLRTSKVNEKATCIDAMDNCVTVFDGSNFIIISNHYYYLCNRNFLLNNYLLVTIIAKGCYSTLPESYRSQCDNNSDDKCHVCYTSLCNDRGAISCLQCNSKEVIYNT